MSALQASALGWTSDATERRIAPTEVMRKIALWFTGQKRFPKVFLTKSCSGMQATINFWLQSHPILKTLWRYMWTLATIMWTTLTLIFLISIQYHGDHHQVNVTISIVDIMEIDELAEKFTIKFNFQRDWFDHRLTYLNLKVKGRLVLWDLKSAEGSLAWSQRSDNRWGNDTLVSGGGQTRSFRFFINRSTLTTSRAALPSRRLLSRTRRWSSQTKNSPMSQTTWPI